MSIPSTHASTHVFTICEFRATRGCQSDNRPFSQELYSYVQAPVSLTLFSSKKCSWAKIMEHKDVDLVCSFSARVGCSRVAGGQAVDKGQVQV